MNTIEKYRPLILFTLVISAFVMNWWLVPFPSIDAYVFCWFFLPLLFYPLYIIAFFSKRLRVPYILICCALLIAVSGWYLQGIPIVTAYISSALIFGAGIRGIQLSRQDRCSRQKNSVETLLVYVLLPLSGALFWPTYLAYPEVLDYWKTRPSQECISHGRLISLGPDAVYRLYPLYGSSFWLTQGHNSINVSSKEFCQSFSTDVATPIDELMFSFYGLCNKPQTKKQKEYCANRPTGLTLSNIELKRTGLVNESGWQRLQGTLNSSRNVKRLKGELPYTPHYFTDWLQTVQLDNDITLYEFYRFGVNIVVRSPDWLPKQPEPLVLSCPQNFNIRCSISYLYRDGWHISYLYYQTKNNDRFNFDEDAYHLYDNNYVENQLANARKAENIASGLLEEMRVQ